MVMVIVIIYPDKQKIIEVGHDRIMTYFQFLSQVLCHAIPGSYRCTKELYILKRLTLICIVHEILPEENVAKELLNELVQVELGNGTRSCRSGGGCCSRRFCLARSTWSYAHVDDRSCWWSGGGGRRNGNRVIGLELPILDKRENRSFIIIQQWHIDIEIASVSLHTSFGICDRGWNSNGGVFVDRSRNSRMSALRAFSSFYTRL